MHVISSRHARAVVTTVVSFLLVLTGLAFLPVAPAGAAQPAFACDTIYSVASASPHTISKINAVTGAVSGNGQFGQGSNETVNALALGANGGRYIYGFNRQTNTVLRYDATTETTATYAAPSNSLAANVVAGAINPANGIYYYAASASGTWTVFAFSTATNTSVGQVATITSNALSTNGDMAFDALGNLYLTTNANATAAGSLARVTGTVPTTAGSTTLGATTLTATPADSGQYTSIAIDDTGLLVIGTSTGRALRVNPATGATVSTTTLSVSLADLASCSVPSTGTVRVNLPEGRYAPTDQFGVTITGGGVTSGNSGTTTGTDSGLQSAAAEVGGAVITQRNTTYTVTQTSAGGTNLANYTTTWACARQSDGTVLTSGNGSTGSYTAPATAADVICTFTNVPLVPSIDLVKTAGALNDVDGNGPDVGDTVAYGYSVTNTGDVTLTSVGVVDTKAGTVTCPQTTLAAGASMTCTSKTYTLTQADVDAGQVVAPATATGTSPTSAVVTDTASTTTTFTRTPRITVVQTPSSVADTNGNGRQDQGDTVTYTHVVANTGNVTLTGVTVTDPLLGTITCPKATLAPNESMTCTPKATTLTQTQVNAGRVDTVATATGTPPAGANVTATSPNSVPVTRTPGIDLTLSGSALADTNANGKVDPGDTVTYAFTVRNTGTVTLDPATVNAPLLGGPITCPTGALAPGATITCTSRSYAVTQADIDAGSLVNTATATGVATNGATVTDTEQVTTPLAQSPSITVVKTASAIADTNGSTKQDAGDRITYSFRVTNTGNVTVSSISVVDAKVGTVTCSPTSLAPGAGVTCTAAPYVLTQADVDAGKVVNTVNAAAASPRGVNVTATDTVTTTITQQPAVRLVKTAGAINDVDAGGTQDAGDTITYSFVVTNTGTTTLSDLTTTDTLLGAVSCPSGDLAPGASVTCTSRTYVLTQGDVNAGSVGSPATVTATSPSDVEVTSTSTTTTPVAAKPSIAVTKVASAIADTNADGLQSAGDRITYTFTVTNTGNVTLDPVSLDDSTVGAVTCAATVVQPGQTVTCTPKAHTLTQADVNAGSVAGTVTATGKPPTGAAVTATAATTTPVAATPRVQLTKNASAVADTNDSGRQDAGDTITYSFTVKNTGNVPLNPVTVTDTTVGTVTCPSGTLAPGATVTCTDKAHVLTQADVDAGVVAGTGTATGKPPTGANVTDIRTTTTPVSQVPSVTIDKSASAIADTNNNGKPDAGDRITYTFKITNNGTVTLTGATVTDPKVGTVTCPTGPIAPGASVTCTPAVYAVTQADVNAGKVVNTATVEATAPGGVEVTANDTVTSPIAAGPVITIDQTVSAISDANDNGRTDAGDTVTYGYVVTNLGNVTLSTVGVTDPRFASVTCPRATLAPQESMTCTPRTYTLTQADVDAGTLPGTATTRGTAPGGATVTDTDSVTTTIPASPAVLLTKTASAIADTNASGAQDVGDRITYSFTVKNTGNVTLDPVTVSDTLLGAITCPAGALAPGASTTCTDKTYVLTQADVDAGSVGSPATATGKPPVGATVTDTRSTTTPITPVPAIQLTKTASAIADTNTNGRQDAGDRITYAFTVKNTGTTTLSNVALSDTLLGAVTCPASIAPGATVTCTPKTYTLTQADVDAGSVGSPATVTGRSPSGATVSDTRSTTTPVTAAPRVSIDKTASAVTDLDGNGTDAGDTVTYGFVVTNTGNVTLNPVTVADTTVGAVTCPTGALAPGASVTCTPRTYPLTQADIDAGSVTGTATATGTSPGGAQVTATDTTATPLAGAGSIALTKTASAIADVDGNGPDAGDQVTYTVTVTNTGAVTLTDVVVTDPLLGTFTCPSGPLAPGATRTCTPIVHPLTQREVDAGSVGSPATTTAKDPSGGTVTATRATSTPIPADPEIRLDLTAGPVVDLDGNGPDAGDTIAYSYVVTNTGNVTLDPTTVSDPTGGPVTCPAGPLAPGASRTCTSTSYVVTQADVEAGSVARQATATGTAPGGAKVTDPDSVTTPIAAAPSISLDKTASPVADLDGNGPDAGDTITYGFVVTNTGNRTLDPVTVTDTLLGAITCPAGPLAPGASRTCTPKTYVVTQDDVEAGSVGSPATATGTVAGGAKVTATDATATPLPAGAKVELDKSAGAIDDRDDNGPDAGDTVTYTFTVTNTGSVNLGGVQVSDPMLGAITCPTTTVAPGRSVSCTPKAYTLTQADVDAGTVVNTASVRATTGGSGGQVVTDTDTHTVTVAPTPRIRIELAAGPVRDLDDNGPDAGDEIDYTPTVTNTGTVTLDGVRVTDPELGPITCPRTTLAPGESMTCLPVTYTVTAADVTAGSVDTTATVVGTSPAGATVRDDDTASTPLPSQVSNLRIDKSVDLADPAPGATVRYTLRVTNDGPATARGVVVTDRLPGGVRLTAADAPCTTTGNDVSCALGALAAGTTRSLVVSAQVLAPVTGAALVQHDLDVQKVEAQVDLEAGQTRTVTAQCGAGYLVTDGSGRVDAVDQGTGTLASVRVLRSSASDDRTWTVTAVNDATGRAQAKVFAVCVKATTEQAGAGTPGGAHAHPLVVSAPVTRPVAVPAGRTEVTLACAPGSVPVVPGYTLDAATGATVTTSYPAAGGWTYVLQAETAGGSATFAQRCLQSTTGETDGHRHELDLAEVRQTVTVPAGETVQVQLSCADDAKGVVAGYDLAPGLVNLGNDPQPKIRVFKLLNPTAGDLQADLFLLCLATRTRGGDGSGVVTNTASVTTTTTETSYADNSDAATFTIGTTTTPTTPPLTPTPAPAPIAAPGSTVVTVAGRGVTTTVRCGAGTTRCVGTASLLAARTQRVGTTTVRQGTVLARATYRLAPGRTVRVTLTSTRAGLQALRSASVSKATLKVGTRSRTVTVRR